MFFEYSSNIALRSLEFRKRSTFVIVKSYTFNTKTNFVSKIFLKNIFFKIFPKCYLNARNIATLREHSANISGILRARLNVSHPWADKVILTHSDILTSKYHKCTGFYEYLEFTKTFSLFYLFDCKFVDLMTFSFFQGKICVPEKSGPICPSLFYGFIIYSFF